MTKLSRQDVYDIAHKYYADGGKVGRNGDGCVYFAPDGGHCGIGVILNHLGITEGDLADEEHDDGAYNTNADAMDVIDFLGDRFTNHLEHDVYKFSPDETKWDSFIIQIQNAHDYVSHNGSNAVMQNLEKFAERYNLVVNPTD